jgi:thioredoxin-related protein
MFAGAPLYAEIDYKQTTTDFIAATVPPQIAIQGIEVKEVLDTESPEWKAVIVYFKRGQVKQPMSIFISADGKTIIPGGMVFVNNKPIFTKSLQPEFEKVSFTLTGENRIVFNPSGKKTVFMFFDADCPYCRQVKEQLKTYSGEYRVVLKHFPLEQIHPKAKGKAIELQSEWMTSKGKGINNLKEEAKKIVEEDIEEGKKAEVQGTPFYVMEDGSVLPPNLAVKIFSKSAGAETVSPTSAVPCSKCKAPEEHTQKGELK